MRSGGGSEPRVSWKGGGLPGCPQENPGPSPAWARLPGTGHCLGIWSVSVQPVVPSVWELLGGDSLVSGAEGAVKGVVRGDGPGAWTSGEALCSSCLGGMFCGQ